MSIRTGIRSLLNHIDLKKTPLPKNLRLDLFFVWLMKNYRKDTVGEFCNTKILDTVTVSVMTNAARARDPDSFKVDQTIPRVYYEVCYSARGPHYKQHHELKDDLRYVLNCVQKIPIPVHSKSDNIPKPLYPWRSGRTGRPGRSKRPKKEEDEEEDENEEVDSYPREDNEYPGHPTYYDPLDNVNTRYM